ncbi:MAG: hypothetical protein I8H73_17080, partial [Pseudomonadales bacterium]|nr:hypothetical protein [Pseudomonadales bacterium]
DVSTKAATMGALQRALGKFSSSTSKAGNYALTVVDAGSEIVAASAASPLTYTMPALSTVANGTCFTVVNLSGQKITLAPTGADRFIGAYDRSGTAASYVIENGDTFTVTKYQGALWLVSSVGGTMFASLATNGYQNLPSGLKECRGTFTASATPGAAVSVTFAQAFTTLQELVITPVNASTTTSSAWHDGATASGFNGRCNIASAVCHYVAKGTV